MQPIKMKIIQLNRMIKHIRFILYSFSYAKKLFWCKAEWKFIHSNSEKWQRSWVLTWRMNCRLKCLSIERIHLIDISCTKCDLLLRYKGKIWFLEFWRRDLKYFNSSCKNRHYFNWHDRWLAGWLAVWLNHSIVNKRNVWTIWFHLKFLIKTKPNSEIPSTEILC